MNIWLQNKFIHYVIKTQESILNTQESRIKTQESRIKNQESTVHRQWSQAWPNSLASRPPIRDGLSSRTPMGSGLRNRPISQSFPEHSSQYHRSVQHQTPKKQAMGFQNFWQKDKLQLYHITTSKFTTLARVYYSLVYSKMNILSKPFRIITL